MDNNDEKNRDSSEGIIIQDSRHSRSGDDIEEPMPEETEEPAPAAPEVHSAPEMTNVDPEPDEPVIEAEAPAEQISEPEPELPDQPGGEPTDHERAEMEHMKMIFGMGLKGYLAGQIAILINFTMINLGRAPNPATGLVATDLDAARLTIDLLEKIMGFVSGELKPTDQTSLTNLVSELKYSYVQAAGGAVPPASPAGGAPK